MLLTGITASYRYMDLFHALSFLSGKGAYILSTDLLIKTRGEVQSWSHSVSGQPFTMISGSATFGLSFLHFSFGD